MKGRYQNLSGEEKGKKRKKAHDRYKNLSEEKKCQYHLDQNSKNILTHKKYFF